MSCRSYDFDSLVYAIDDISYEDIDSGQFTLFNALFLNQI